MPAARREEPQEQSLHAIGTHALANEEADYEQIYHAHRLRVLRLCHLLLGDADEAQEVSQEVFLKLHRALTGDGAPIKWGPWLKTVAVNACRDRRRTRWWRWGRTSEVFIDELHAGNALTPEQSALSRETRDRIWRAFQTLSTRQREVFALRHLEGWSTDEVADTLRMSTGSVKRHLFRAVQHMRSALGESR
jgi:RNA polymerase sigma-70 factor (ECF subfamily)